MMVCTLFFKIRFLHSFNNSATAMASRVPITIFDTDRTSVLITTCFVLGSEKTLPGMSMIIILMSVLNMGNILNAGFDQVYNLYSPGVYESGDRIRPAKMIHEIKYGK